MTKPGGKVLIQSLGSLIETRMVSVKMWWAFLFTSGSMYVKDYVRELERLNIPIDQLELDELNRISDSTGKVCSPSKSECKLTCFPTDWKS